VHRDDLLGHLNQLLLLAHRLAAQVQGQALGLGTALGGGDDQWRRVGQGHEAEFEGVPFRGIGTGSPGQDVGVGRCLVVGHRVDSIAAQKGSVAAVASGDSRLRRHCQ
jgi:hypothetical protein